MYRTELKRVRNYSDIIHGIIPYNGFEKIILQTPLLMRLQRISQNSLVFLTFPSNKVKRFEHSLGVMHLGNKCIRSALINTDTATLNDFFHSIKEELLNWTKNIKRENRNGALAKYPDKYFDNNNKNYNIWNFMEQKERYWIIFNFLLCRFRAIY